MSPEALFPSAVFTIWRVGLVVTIAVFVPLAVYLLHSTWRAARSIELYAREALQAAAGILDNTKAIPALDATIGTATGMLSAATSVAKKLETVADVMQQRAR